MTEETLLATSTIPKFDHKLTWCCIAQMTMDGTHDLPIPDADMWISMLFFQPKGRQVNAEFDDPWWGLYKKGDVLEALRPLKDQRDLN